MTLNEKISVLFSFPYFLGANVYALTHARVIRFDKKYFLKGGLDKARFEFRSAQNIQNNSDLIQYLGADSKQNQEKNNQLQQILKRFESKYSSSSTVLI